MFVWTMFDVFVVSGHKYKLFFQKFFGLSPNILYMFLWTVFDVFVSSGHIYKLFFFKKLFGFSPDTFILVDGV